MSKKLLEEEAVRKFMKIAGLQPLTNGFLNETWDEAKKKDDKEDVKEEAKKADDKKEDIKEEAKDKDGDKLEEVEDLEEAKDELEEGGGQMPFDAQDRRADDRAPDSLQEKKALSASVSGKGKKQASHSMKPAAKSTKNGSSGKPLQEEELPEPEMGDVEAPEADMPPADTSGLDVEGLVKELIRVITDKIPGAADVVSVEAENEEAPEMGGEEEDQEEAKMMPPAGEEEEEGMMPRPTMDEASLEKVVAETVKRVKARLMESQKASTAKQQLVKKVTEKVANRLKKA